MSLLGDGECLMDDVACLVRVFSRFVFCFKFFAISVSKIGSLVMVWLSFGDGVAVVWVLLFVFLPQ
jgi:hypothetical protein